MLDMIVEADSSVVVSGNILHPDEQAVRGLPSNRDARAIYKISVHNKWMLFEVDPRVCFLFKNLSGRVIAEQLLVNALQCTDKLLLLVINQVDGSKSAFTNELVDLVTASD